MTTGNTIFRIEAAPGDAPRGVEQPNGDLLVPANARPLLAQALRDVEKAFFKDLDAELPALKDARRLLGIEQPSAKRGWLSNLYRIRSI